MRIRHCCYHFLVQIDNHMVWKSSINLHGEYGFCINKQNPTEKIMKNPSINSLDGMVKTI